MKKTEEKKEHGFQVMANIGLREELLLGSALRKKKTETSPEKPFCLSVFFALSFTVTVGCGAMEKQLRKWGCLMLFMAEKKT